MRPKLPRNVKVLSAVSFLQDAASDLVYPVLPLFITQTLGAPPSVLGLVEGVAEGTAGVRQGGSGPPGPPVWARRAPRFPPRPLTPAGYSISALGKPLIAAAGPWGVVLVARFV